MADEGETTIVGDEEDFEVGGGAGGGAGAGADADDGGGGGKGKGKGKGKRGRRGKGGKGGKGGRGKMRAANQAWRKELRDVMNAEGPAAQAARCRKTFDELDENKNGTLDRKELFGLLRKMGLERSDAEFRRMAKRLGLRKVIQDKDGEDITFEDFFGIYKALVGNQKARRAARKAKRAGADAGVSDVSDEDSDDDESDGDSESDGEEEEEGSEEEGSEEEGGDDDAKAAKAAKREARKAQRQAKRQERRKARAGKFAEVKEAFTAADADSSGFLEPAELAPLLRDRLGLQASDEDIVAVAAGIVAHVEAKAARRGGKRRRNRRKNKGGGDADAADGGGGGGGGGAADGKLSLKEFGVLYFWLNSNQKARDRLVNRLTKKFPDIMAMQDEALLG